VTLRIRDPAYEARIRASFARQRFMSTLGARLERIEPGEVEIALPFRDDLTQQHGFLHAGVVTSIVDSACGYAALSVMEPGAGVVSVEFKVNLLAPAVGTDFRAIGRVVKSGRTLIVCSGELHAIQDERDTLVALMQGTMMAVTGRAGMED
jgi:uncharacterized protein (TIGR00369 family)